MIRQLALIVASALLLAGCDASQKEAGAGRAGFGTNGRRDLTGLGADARGEKGGQTYAAFDALRDREGTGLMFAGYGCMSDCTDVMEGYRKARKGKITQARLCKAPTWGEVEGCVAFTQGLPSELSARPPLRE